MKQREPKTPLTVHLNDELLARLKEHALIKGMSMRKIVEFALKEYLEKNQIQLTLKGLENEK